MRCKNGINNCPSVLVVTCDKELKKKKQQKHILSQFSDHVIERIRRFVIQANYVMHE